MSTQGSAGYEAHQLLVLAMFLGATGPETAITMRQVLDGLDPGVDPVLQGRRPNFYEVEHHLISLVRQGLLLRVQEEGVSEREYRRYITPQGVAHWKANPLLAVFRAGDAIVAAQAAEGGERKV